MKYGIYFTRSNSNDNYQTSTNGWHNETPYNTMRAAKYALEAIACMFNDDLYNCTYKDKRTLECLRTDNIQPSITEKVTFKICVYHI